MFFRWYKSKQIILPFCHNPRLWQTDRRRDERTDGPTLRQIDKRTPFSSLARVGILCSAVKQKNAY